MLDFPPVRVVAPPPGVASVPLVLDSPHSGQRYPADFGHACDLAHLTLTIFMPPHLGWVQP
jgi:N-formylglutamate amidohydrolase